MIELAAFVLVILAACLTWAGARTPSGPQALLAVYNEDEPCPDDPSETYHRVDCAYCGRPSVRRADNTCAECGHVK